MARNDDPKARRAGQSGDDFQKINGIGRVLERRLWDAGILTYSDLAERTPEEIAAVAGVSAERIARENWIGQARELAGPPPKASIPRQYDATFHVQFRLESDNRVRSTKVRHHQTDVGDEWPGWDEEKLLTFLRDRIPLPAAARPSDKPGPERAETQTPAQPPASAPAMPTGQPSPRAREPLPSWSLRIEELAPVCGDQRSYTRGPSELNCVRLTMCITPAGELSHDVFDYSVVIAARTFAGRERSAVGTVQGTIRVSDPVSVNVTGPALPAGVYRLVATVEIYAAGHSPEEPPLYSQGVSGDLMRVAGPPLGSASAA